MQEATGLAADTQQSERREDTNGVSGCGKQCEAVKYSPCLQRCDMA